MRAALKALDAKLSLPTKLLIGGGAAMLLAHGFPVSTMDIDGVLFQSEMTQADLDPLVKQVAQEMHIPADWLNSYFNTFLYPLPADYAERLIEIYHGVHLRVLALSMEDLLILKCFAGRPKDQSHARALLRKISRRDIVDEHLQQLLERHVPGAESAVAFYDDLIDEVDDAP